MMFCVQEIYLQHCYSDQIDNSTFENKKPIKKLLVLSPGLSVGGGRTIAHTHAGTRPNLCLGAIDHVPGKRIFSLKRVISHLGVHSEYFVDKIIFVFKHTL